MADMNVTYGEMTAAASQLKAGQSDIAAELKRLHGVVNQLASEGFQTDKAGPAFQQSYAEFNSGMSQAIEGLGGMASYLMQAAQVIEDTDTQLAAGIK